MDTLFLSFVAIVTAIFLKRGGGKKSRRVLGHNVLSRDGYDHRVLLDPNGQFLSYIDEKRFSWYLAKGLAALVKVDTIKLNFEPKGNGGRDDKYYSSKQANHCVVCGNSENYTKHHVIPKEFRIHFPLELKDHHSHDLVLVCAKCHEEYETVAMHLKKELSEKYNVPIHGFGRIENAEIKRIQKDVQTIVGQRNNAKFPKEKMNELVNNVKMFLRKDNFTEEDLDRVLKMETVDSTGFITFGEAIVDVIAGKERNLEKIQEFSIFWRNHFVGVMKPKFLNEFWDKDKSV
jgi:hypothetical protein